MDGNSSGWSPGQARNGHCDAEPCGTGKSWLSCAFGHKACLEGFKVRYHRFTRLLNELRIAHGENRVAKLYREFARMDLVILDDFGLASIDAARARDLLEIVDDRHGYRSVIVTSQYPLSDWHRQLGDPTIADAILDRLVHGAIRFELSGSSWRETGADSMTEDGKA